MTKRESNVKSGALAALAGSGNIPLVILSYSFTYGKPDAGAAVLRLAVETLEDAEDVFGVLLIETNTIVTDLDMGVVAFCPAGNADHRRPVGTGILEGIGDEVAEQLGHLEGNSIEGGQVLILEPRVFLLDEQLEFHFDLRYYHLQIDLLEDGRLPRQFRIAKDIPPQRLHPLTGCSYFLYEAFGLLAHIFRTVLQHTGIRED